MRPALLGLVDIAPDASTEAQVRALASRVAGILGLDKCFVRKMGLSFYVDLHIVVDVKSRRSRSQKDLITSPIDMAGEFSVRAIATCSLPQSP
jgi:divalent metal cation (Fe/Co/Zn/Cd) transporter